MTTDPQVTHPPVTHPETPAPAVPEPDSRKPEKPSTGRPVRRSLRIPPPKILAAAALVVVALELLVWQVGGPFWGGVIHGVLLILVGFGLLVWLRGRSRRDARLGRAALGPIGRAAAGGQRAARGARGPLGRLLRRNGRAASGASGGGGGSARRGLLSRLTGGRRGGAASGGGRSGAGAKRSGGLLGRLGRSGASGRRTGSGAGRSAGRAGGLLGRLGRGSGTGSGRGPSGTSRSGRSRSGGLLGRLGGAAKRATARRQATEKRPGIGRGQWGVRLGQRASAGTWRPNWGKARKQAAKLAADFRRGVREGSKASPQPKKPSPEPKPTEQAPTPAAGQEKPQPPTRDELVKEAVEKVADATPAPVTSRRSRGTTVGSMRDILAAAEDLAGQLKAYDEEDMHVFVRELPQLGDALSAIEGGIKMMASRAESEWPLAAPVVEALGSVAGDVKAAASTVGEAKTAVYRENETDIERGEAPRQGERRWNV
ncbi:hypothetical protein ACGF5C_31465 [Micromonospora sp. NPDC047620]|uniref:hypothetical protein n=1 Tax=Micromonospora sp. NPDC047620 TaxID=3364251 RepID=UPI0037216FB1